MTHEEKEAIRGRCNKATLGPWRVSDEGVNRNVRHEGRGAPIAGIHEGEAAPIAAMWEGTRSETRGPGTLKKDAEFIAHARQDIPALLDALDKAESRIEALERAIKSSKAKCYTCVYGNGGNPPPICPEHLGGKCDRSTFDWQFDEARFSNQGGKNERACV